MPPKDFEAGTPTALVTALALVAEHGGAAGALRVTGLDLDDFERFEGVTDEVRAVLAGLSAGEALGEAPALGFLAAKGAC